MLADLMEALAGAKSKKEKEKAYRHLKLVGMDRRTADALVAEMKKKEGRKA